MAATVVCPMCGMQLQGEDVGDPRHLKIPEHSEDPDFAAPCPGSGSMITSCDASYWERP
jgi:hypothetical protein